MGTSWTIAIELSAVNATAWNGARVDPRKLAGVPAELGPFDGRPMSVNKVLLALEDACPGCLEWVDDGVSVGAVIADDSAFFIDRRGHLIAAVANAGRFEGVGQMWIGSADDNPSTLLFTVDADGAVSTPTGAARDAAEARLSAVEARVMARAQATTARRALASDDLVDGIHRRIVAALRGADPEAVLSAARRLTHTVLGGPQHAQFKGPFGTLYDAPGVLLDALERGDARAHPWMASTYLAASLEILAAVDRRSAEALADEASSARAAHQKSVPPQLRSFFIAALAITTERDALGPAALLEALRDSLESADIRGAGGFALHPVVMRLARTEKAEALPAIRAAIAEVLGSPEQWKKISERDATFGFVLAILLVALGETQEDRALVQALRAHPHWMIAASKREHFAPRTHA